MTIARRIVTKLGIEKQVRFAMSKVAPLFAGQIIAGISTPAGQASPLAAMI